MRVGILCVVDDPAYESEQADKQGSGVGVPAGQKLGNKSVELLHDACHIARWEDRNRRRRNQGSSLHVLTVVGLLTGRCRPGHSSAAASGSAKVVKTKRQLAVARFLHNPQHVCIEFHVDRRPLTTNY